MSNFCIISEFNPLHNGHCYLLNKARELGADNVICIMSGNATQRGELAITDKYLRAEAAVKCGADLVLELPFPWCSASADYFASAAVRIASDVGDVLLFGSECGDINLLEGAAEVCETNEFQIQYEKYTRDGMGAASAYVKCLAERGFAELYSNDLLGIAYIRAIKRMGVAMTPMTVRRIGASYNEKDTVDTEYQSATAMRNAITQKNGETLKQFLPTAMYDIVVSESNIGRITEFKEAESAVLGYFRLCEENHFENIADAGGGIANRLIFAAKSAGSLDAMQEILKTKRYTDAKLRRAMLFCLTSVRAEMLKSLPEYTLLLAANADGCEILSSLRKRKIIPIVTKPADAPKQSEQFKVSQRLDLLYGLARKSKLSEGDFIRKKAYIAK